MTQRRTFTAEFKTQVVLDLISGAHSVAELCRQHQLNPQLLSRWKMEFLQRASLVFEQDQQRSSEQERIAELERPVGRLMRTIKEEEVDLSEYENYAAAVRQVGCFLDEVYMHKRIHSSLGYLTPAEFESQWWRQ